MAISYKHSTDVESIIIGKVFIFFNDYQISNVYQNICLQVNTIVHSAVVKIRFHALIVSQIKCHFRKHPVIFTLKNFVNLLLHNYETLYHDIFTGVNTIQFSSSGNMFFD